MRWLSLLAVATVACGGGEDSIPDEPLESGAGVLRVYTVNYPLQYFAERIGGEHVEVSFLAGPGVDPASWNPDPDTIVQYQRADLIVLNGAGYAKWVATATLPESKLVDTSLAFTDRTILVEDAVVHRHGPEGEHSHGETASTTWLDPSLALEHAAAIRDALVSARPEHASSFHGHFASLEEDLAALDQRLETAITGGADVLVVGARPVYQYLARRYGLQIPSVRLEPDSFSDPSGWDNLAQLLEELPATWMIWADEPATEVAKRLQEMGVASVVFDPCATRPPTGDYLTVMRSNAEAIESIFSPQLRSRP